MNDRIDETLMDVNKLKILINEYYFTQETLLEYLGLSKKQLNRILNENKIFENNKSKMFMVQDKIDLLYYSTIMDANIELQSFLNVLIVHHGISIKSIAKIAGVSQQDVECCLKYEFNEVSCDVKYKIAIAAMRLRFLFKECEVAVVNKKNI